LLLGTIYRVVAEFELAVRIAELFGVRAVLHFELLCGLAIAFAIDRIELMLTLRSYDVARLAFS
jgi:hypothetical protein